MLKVKYLGELGLKRRGILAQHPLYQLLGHGHAVRVLGYSGVGVVHLGVNQLRLDVINSVSRVLQ